MAASEVPAGLQLTSLDGQSRPVDEWLITFQLLGVVLDPYTYESAWLLDTAGRILEGFRGASVRTAIIVTCDADAAKEFLGAYTDQVLVLVDPDRAFVRAFELDELPAFVHLRQNRRIGGVAQGWDPAAWKEIAGVVAAERHWSRPMIPAAGDPAPYRGSAALEATGA
ncbi:MAG: hypothetical protein FJW83_11675 [Actinobacteria bacterium]|nr:hypothetical protein [Actinomycetota bacterium]